MAMDRDPNLYGQDTTTTGNTKVYDPNGRGPPKRLELPAPT